MQQIPDISQLMHLANSPAGQQLLNLLQQNGGNELKNAAEQAARGDYQQAKKMLNSLLASPDAQRLLKQLEENYE